MPALTFYTNPMSRGRIVRWMLEEIGEPYETRVLEYGPPMQTPAYRALNPMGKVPTLVHGETVVTEAAAICAYLADAFPAAGLAPSPGSPARGAYYRWLFFGAGPVEAAVTDSSMGLTPESPDAQRRAGYGSLARVLDTLSAHLSGNDYLLGDRFSAADVYTGMQLVWARMFGNADDRPGFAAYAERLMARPAAIRARQLDDALLPAPGGAG